MSRHESLKATGWRFKSEVLLSDFKVPLRVCRYLCHMSAPKWSTDRFGEYPACLRPSVSWDTASPLGHLPWNTSVCFSFIHIGLTTSREHVVHHATDKKF